MWILPGWDWFLLTVRNQKQTTGWKSTSLAQAVCVNESSSFCQLLFASGDNGCCVDRTLVSKCKQRSVTPRITWHAANSTCKVNPLQHTRGVQGVCFPALKKTQIFFWCIQLLKCKLLGNRRTQTVSLHDNNNNCNAKKKANFSMSGNRLVKRMGQ